MAKLDVYTPLPDLDEALAGSDEFGDKIACFKRQFEANGIVTLNDLENSPRYLSCTTCGCSTGRLIIYIRGWMENAALRAINEVVKEQAKPKRKKKKVVERVIEEPEPVVVAEAYETVKETEEADENGEVSTVEEKE